MAGTGFGEDIVVVSGLPRSGTSMMMRMLEAGGVPSLSDGVRAADADNPQGYYEFDPVKRLRTDKTWVPKARGKAVKVVSLLLPELPADFRYRVIFMRRGLDDVLASQRRMLARQGAPEDAAADSRMRAHYEKHLERVRAWLAQQAHVSVLEAAYEDVVVKAWEVVEGVNTFLGGGLRTEAMRGIVRQGSVDDSTSMGSVRLSENQ